MKSGDLAMNPIWLVKNVRRVVALCPTWRDRWQSLSLTYGRKLPGWAKSNGSREISFRYSPPIGLIKVLLRDNFGADAFIFGEVFDHRYYDFDLPVVPKTILDLGANVGYTAIFFGRKFTNAEIACVEPMPHNVAVLRQNLSMNAVVATVIDAAATVEDSIVQMETHPRDYGHRIAVDPMQTTASLVSCKGISVPSIMKQMGWNRIGLLKVDIEGYERILFTEDCDWLTLIDAMCIECHPGYGETEVRQLATAYGFCEPRESGGIWLLCRQPATTH